MFDWQERDEGFLLVRNSDGKAVAHIDTKTIGETNDPNLRVQQRIEKKIPREEWRVSFTAVGLKPGEIKALLDELHSKE